MADLSVSGWILKMMGRMIYLHNSGCVSWRKINVVAVLKWIKMNGWKCNGDKWLKEMK